MIKVVIQVETMPPNRSLPRRKSIRLQEFDYSQPGAFFITICTLGQTCNLGEVNGEEMRLNSIGQIAADGWEDTVQHFPGIAVDDWVVMPNHVHAIICITDSCRGWVPQPAQRGEESAKTAPVPRIPPPSLLARTVAYYKYQTTKKINLARISPGIRFWQRNYYEHIIRSVESMEKIQQYIIANPARWHEDQLFPGAPPNRFNRP